MKKLCLLFSLCPVFLWGQVKIDFENGLPADLEQFPVGRWGVSNEDPLQGSQSLRHIYDNAGSSSDAFSFPLSVPDPDSMFCCSFIVRYQYTPSGSNNWCFYLLSEMNGSGFTENFLNNALMIGVNQDGTDDSLRIYQQSSGKISRLLNCNLHCENDMGFLPWQFEIRIEPGNSLVIEGGVYPGSMKELSRLDSPKIPGLHAAHAGASYSYTSSKDRLLTFDSIVYQYHTLIDSIPPLLLSTRVESPGMIEMKFNENLYMDEFNPPEIHCSLVVDTFFISANFFYIRFGNEPPNYKVIDIEIKGLTDRYGNPVFLETQVSYYYPGWHDVLFSELMANPSPPVYLPEIEYLEIYNRSGHVLNLENWELATGSRRWILPELFLESGAYHFFCYGDAYLHYSEKKHYTSLFSSASVLSNEGQLLTLYTPDHVLIDALEYSVSWYNGDFTAEGGWSLERTDLQNLCGGREIWKPSNDIAGGTPGKENSHREIVYDNEPPFIQYVLYEGDSIFLLRFNETLGRDYFNEARESILKENDMIRDIEFTEPFFNECRIHIKSPDHIGEMRFQNQWKDCSGNLSEVMERVNWASPENVSAFDILITEVLYSPWPGCPEFIELYNNSDKTISLYDLNISIAGSSEQTRDGKQVTGEKILFFPGTYLVLSKNPFLLGKFYDVPARPNFLQVNDMPSLSDAGASIRLFDRANMLVDEFVYSPDNQFPLLEDLHGVSLERVKLDRLAGNSSQWHSASSISGFATPGYQNSQFMDAKVTEDDLSVEDKLFTPNNDGDKDLAIFHIKMEKEGYVAMIRVFDSNGRLCRILGYNELLGIENTLFWDGRDDSGIICTSGIYLVHLDAYHLSGGRKMLKKTVVLGRK